MTRLVYRYTEMTNLGKSDNPASFTVSIPPLPTTVRDVRINIDSESKDTTKNTKKLMICSILTMFIVSFPFIFLDLYISYTDNSCVNQEVSKMSITLKTWLLVSGYINIFNLILGCIFAVYLMIKNSDTAYFIGSMISTIFKLFNLSWNIVGAVLFWGYMNIDVCNTLTRNYVFARLIISFVTSSMICSSKKKD